MTWRERRRRAEGGGVRDEKDARWTEAGGVGKDPGSESGSSMGSRLDTENVSSKTFWTFLCLISKLGIFPP